MFRSGWLAVAVVAGCLAFPAVGLAATFTVNTTADNPPSGSECSGAPGDCSLRQALDKAASGDTVSVPASASAYQVTGTPISINASVSIVGGGASGTTVTGGGANQIFVVQGGGSVSISAITLTDGNAVSFPFFGGGAISDDGGGDVTLDQVAITNTSSSPIFGGGAILDLNGGNLTITRSRFTGDSVGLYSDDGGGAILFFTVATLSVSDTEFANDTVGFNNFGSFGGAVSIVDAPSGSATFNRVTFDGNSVYRGGEGGAVDVEGSAAFYNSTFTGNMAPFGFGGAVAGGNVSAVNDTFAGNSAQSGADVVGNVAAQNSIFANPQGSEPQGGGGSCAGGITDNGNNLEDASPSSCGFTSVNGDIVGQSPQLALALADNGDTVATAGGPPQTLALSSTSPALHAASAAGCATVGSVDERNMPRPGEPGTGCDIGAFELQFHTLSVTMNGSGSGTVSGGGISCPGTCSVAFPEGTQPEVSLTASPAGGSSFAGWGGDCAGQAGCAVTMSTDHAVSATFTHSAAQPASAAVAASHTLSVSVSGSGTVTGGGISCPGSCSKSYASGTKVTLQATPATGYSFAGWSGDCTGKSSCSVTMSSDRSVKATFTRKQLRLAVNPASAHAGTNTCFRFTVTSGGTAIGGAKVHLAGKTATTSRHGHAQICVTLATGVHQARATKSPYRQALLAVRMTRPPSPPHLTFTG